MNIQEARDIVNQKFRYELDGKVDTWEVLNTEEETIKGDCEDYSLTLIWLAEDRNILKFLFALFIAKYTMWFMKTPNGVGHASVYVRSEGKFIDNIKKDFHTKEEYEKDGFKFRYPLFSVLILPKLIFSYTIGLFFR